MDLDGSSLLLAMVISAAGFVCFRYGKSQSRFPQMLAGVLLMAFPYFVSSLPIMAAIATAIFGILWLAIRLGW